MLNGPLSVPAIHTMNRFNQPAFGEASRTQLVAPRNGGVMKVSSTMIRTSCLPGMLVRATAQAIGTASSRQNVATDAPRMNEFLKPIR